MVEISDWKPFFKQRDWIYIFLILYISLIAITIINFFSKDYLEKSIDYLIFIFLFGLCLSLIIIIIFKNKKRYYGGLLLLSSINIYIITSFIDADSIYGGILSTLSFNLIYTGLIISYTFGRSDISIIVKNPHSVILFKKILNEIKKELTQKNYEFNYFYSNLNIYYMLIKIKIGKLKKGTLWIWMEYDNDNKYNYYKIALLIRLNKKLNKILTETIKDILIKLDSQHSFDDYSGNEIFFCKYCKKNVSFSYHTFDRFQCLNCKKYFNEDEVELFQNGDVNESQNRLSYLRKRTNL